MPFKSKAQARFMFANHPKGVNLKEWADKTDWKGLPEKKAFQQGFKHGADPDSKFIPAQLRRGTDVETEHTNDRAVAKQIAKAHLAEIPDYYTRLAKMEDEAK